MAKLKKALCVGNAAYPNDSLRNPVNDARGTAERLEALGFESTLSVDADRIAMEKCLATFSRDLADAEVGLYFFAGHGMQIDGENYLAAVDTAFDTELDAKYSSLPLNKVIDTLDRGCNTTSIIILDACRNNPYEQKWRGAGNRGLAPVYAPKGMFIAYATSPGQVAFDGIGSNGAFTSSLLKHLSQQGLTIETLFKRVRNTLSAVTSGKQISWEHTCLMGEFFFNHPIPSSELIAEYSQSALSDSQYQCRPGRPVDSIIDKLGSYDWHKQNPAIEQMDGVDWAKTEKDELFVLGRNLYQAACGHSWRAESYLGDLADNLKSLDEGVAFHILNGMLYEIYFDSHGRFRTARKTGFLDEVLILDGAKLHERSFAFIRQALKSHEDYLFYVPGAAQTLCVDVVNTMEVESTSQVLGITVNGQDVLYDEGGETLIANATVHDSVVVTQDDFKSRLATEMTLPKRCLELTFAHALSYRCSIDIPWPYKIQRISK